jgi:hypothetical protein
VEAMKKVRFRSAFYGFATECYDAVSEQFNYERSGIFGSIPNWACLLNSSRLRPRKPRFRLGVTLMLSGLS